MKYLLGAVLLIGSFFIGKIIAAKYRQKVDFWREFRAFLVYLQGEIGFFQKKMADVVAEYVKDKKSPFPTFVAQYPVLLGDREEEKAVKTFFDKTNNVDIATINALVAYEITQTDLKIAESEKIAATNGGLAKKICPLVGVALFLMAL